MSSLKLHIVVKVYFYFKRHEVFVVILLGFETRIFSFLDQRVIYWAIGTEKTIVT